MQPDSEKISPTLLLGILVVIYILVVYLGSVFSFMLSVLYPLLVTYNVLVLDGKERYKQLLLFWVIFGLFILVDTLIPVSRVIPFYYFFKIGVLLWCLSRQSKGGEVLYFLFIKPLFSAHYAAIDRGVVSIRKHFHLIVDPVCSLFIEATESYKKDLQAQLKNE